MASIKFILAIVAVACAAQAHAQSIPTVGETSVRSRPELKIEAHVSRMAIKSAASDAARGGIDKLKKLVERIVQRISLAERELRDALQCGTEIVLRKINEQVLKITNINLELPKKLEDLEAKVQSCAIAEKPELKALIDQIKTQGTTCAAQQVADAAAIKKQLTILANLAETVPSRTAANIKACGIDEEDKSHQLEESKIQVPITPLHTLRIRGFPSFRTIECVSGEIAEAAKELQDVPQLVYDLVREIRALSSQETKKTIATCGAQLVLDADPKLQQAAADLAACIIAPAKKE